MKSEKTISAQIGAVKSAIVALGDMRPGHLSFQRRVNGKNPRCYAQLSYTFKKQSRTDYVVSAHKSLDPAAGAGFLAARRPRVACGCL